MGGLSDIIPDVQKWAQKFAASDLQTAHDAVKGKLAIFATYPLDKQIKKLEYEIKWVADSSFDISHKIYPTAAVAEAAYNKALAAAQTSKAINLLTPQLDAVKAIANAHPKAKTLATAIQSVEAAIKAGNVAEAEKFISSAQTLAAKFESKKAGKTIKAFTADAYSQNRKDAAVWCQSLYESRVKWQNRSRALYQKATPAEQKAIYEYTKGSGHMNRPLRGYDGSWSNFKGVGNVPLDNEGGEANIINAYNFIGRCKSGSSVK